MEVSIIQHLIFLVNDAMVMVYVALLHIHIVSFVLFFFRGTLLM